MNKWRLLAKTTPTTTAATISISTSIYRAIPLLHHLPQPLPIPLARPASRARQTQDCGRSLEREVPEFEAEREVQLQLLALLVAIYYATTLSLIIFKLQTSHSFSLCPLFCLLAGIRLLSAHLDRIQWCDPTNNVERERERDSTETMCWVCNGDLDQAGDVSMHYPLHGIYLCIYWAHSAETMGKF